MENEHPWRYSNCVIYNSQREDIDQAKVLDFDSDAIQIIEDVELQQLPEIINKEIVKNSQEIVFKEKQGNLKENLIKLHGKKDKNYAQEIVSEEEEEVLMQRAVKRNIINREKEEILTNSQEIIFEEKEGDIPIQTLIKLNKETGKILKRNLSLKKIDFEEKKEKFLEKNMMGLNKEKVGMQKNSEEIISKERDFSEIILAGLNVKNANILRNSNKIEEREGVFEKKLAKLGRKG